MRLRRDVQGRRKQLQGGQAEGEYEKWHACAPRNFYFYSDDVTKIALKCMPIELARGSLA